MIIPGLEWNNDSFSKSETIWIGFTVYFCLGVFIYLLIFCIHNIWKYLIGQGKWRVFPLTLFYSLALLMIAVRIYATIMTAEMAINFGI